MKNSVLQFTKQAVNDNKQYIDGNVAEHLILTTQSLEHGYFEYLTEEEIEEFENNSKRRAELETEVEKFINDNFNFDIEEFEY
jgi:hypothetical protein